MAIRDNSSDKNIIGGEYNKIFDEIKKHDTIRKIILCGVTDSSKLHPWGFYQYFHQEINEIMAQNKEIILLPSTATKDKKIIMEQWEKYFPKQDKK